MPGALTSGVSVLPPLSIVPPLVDQVYWNVGPFDDCDASIVMVVTSHVNSKVGKAPTNGMFTSAATVTEVVVVQPLRVLVTIKVYVPMEAAVAVMPVVEPFSVPFPVDHW